MREAEILDLLRRMQIHLVEQEKAFPQDLRYGFRGLKEAVGYWEEEYQHTCNAKSTNWKEQALRRIKRSYGGMGSFNDGFIDREWRDMQNQLYDVVSDELEWLSGQDHTPVKF